MDIQRLARNKYAIAAALAIGALLYYLALYSREFTWIYTSGDAGDWLTQLRWWMVPHTFGKPLYISLIHLVSYLPFGSDVAKITIFLSVIPGAITVGMTYLIAFKLTESRLRSIVVALVILGAVIVTTQASVLEQYAFMGMLFSISYYFYISGRKKLTMLFLGLLTATHVIGLVLCLFFVAREKKEIKSWIKPLIVYSIVGFGPYLLILGMMATDTPKFIAGSLSIPSLVEYMIGNSTTGVNLAIIAFPERIITATIILLTSTGLAIVPAFRSKSEMSNKLWTLTMVIVLFTLWFYMTNLFPSTWKYVAVTFPAFCALAAVGMKKMNKRTIYAIGACALILIGMNGVFFNSSLLAEEKPLATEYSSFLETTPEGSAVLTPRGGPYGFGLIYAMSKGTNIIPVMLSPEYTEESAEGSYSEAEKQSYMDYIAWSAKVYKTKGEDCQGIIENILKDGQEVYFPNPSDYWFTVFEMSLFELDNKIYLVSAVK